MGYFKRAGHIISLAAIFFIQSCSGDVDLGGFFYTEERSNERFDNSMDWNQVHPEKNIIVNSDNYTFLVAGDSHCGPTANLDYFIEKSHEPEISFSLIAGDVTTGLKNDYDTVMKHLTGFAPVPYFVAVGNHDLFFHGWISFTENFGSSVYTFTVTSLSGKDLFICVDTGTGTLGPKQMQWLKETIKNTRSNYRNCIIFTHVNFFREHRVQSTTILVEEVYALLDLFADHSVDIMIMGHDHSNAVENFGNTLYITLDALEDDFDDASYLSISNQKGTLSYKFIGVN
ncbi:MAG: metallophosphoesterase [Bacteroidales bacterium]|nr:metallophosphoesterase [Bacteroidales bacterium]